MQQNAVQHRLEAPGIYRRYGNGVDDLEHERVVQAILQHAARLDDDMRVGIGRVVAHPTPRVLGELVVLQSRVQRGRAIEKFLLIVFSAPAVLPGAAAIRRGSEADGHVDFQLRGVGMLESAVTK